MSPERLLGRGRNPEITTLTAREMEVMLTVVRCYGSTKIAAHKLGLTRRTVQNYRSICYAKTGTSCAAEFWAAMGWLRLPPPR